jgi:hypothetical protein
MCAKFSVWLVAPQRDAYKFDKPSIAGAKLTASYKSSNFGKRIRKAINKAK